MAARSLVLRQLSGLLVSKQDAVFLVSKENDDGKDEQRRSKWEALWLEIKMEVHRTHHNDR